MDKQEMMQTLKRYRGLHLECQRYRKRIADKRNTIYDVKAVVTSGANVRSGAIADRVERVIEKLNLLIDLYTRKMEEADEAERQITELIDRVSDNVERVVLFMHYIEGKSFLEIADVLYLSERTVWYRHGCAINSLCNAV